MDKLFLFRRLRTDLQVVLCIHEEPTNQFKRAQHFMHHGILQHTQRDTYQRKAYTHRSGFRPRKDIPPRGFPCL